MPPAAFNTLSTTLRLFAPRGKTPLGATLSHLASLLCSMIPKVWRRLSSGLLVCQHRHEHVPTWLDCDSAWFYSCSALHWSRHG